MAALVAVPGGNLMAPPELPGNAPVVDVLHPVGIGLAEPLGHELDPAVPDHLQRRLGQRLHLHKPLGGDQGLHVVVAAVAGAHVVGVVLHLFQEAQGFQVGHHGLAGLVAVHAAVLAAVFIDGAVVVEDADGLEIVPETHLEVVGVVGRGHLDAAGAEVHLHVLVGHNGDLPVHQRQDAGLPHQVLVALVGGVHGHAGIAHHGLGPGGGHHQIPAGAVGQRIAQMPQMAGLIGVLHLGVGEGRQAVGAPVDDTAALVDQTLVVELAEGLPDGLGAALVHGEAAAAPVAGSAQLHLLLDDPVAVFLLPVPDPLQEFLPAQVIAGQALLVAERLLHLDLGGDARVVGAGQPEGGIALHPLKAGQNVLEGGVQGVAHVELAGDVRRRHDDGEGRLLRVRLGAEAVVVQPGLVDLILDHLRVVGLGQFACHVIHSYKNIDLTV